MRHYSKTHDYTASYGYTDIPYSEPALLCLYSFMAFETGMIVGKLVGIKSRDEQLLIDFMFGVLLSSMQILFYDQKYEIVPRIIIIALFFGVILLFVMNFICKIS